MLAVGGIHNTGKIYRSTPALNFSLVGVMHEDDLHGHIHV
jgi:hypothetical protein